MADREAWLALTQEDALAPELPICDPHHHFWVHPGSRYLSEEFLADISGGHRVRKTVFVECLQFYRPDGAEAMRPVGETERVEQLAGSYPLAESSVELAAGIVGFADLRLGQAVKPVLEAHMQASKRFRGIRYATAWDASEQVHNAHTRPSPDLMQDQNFHAGLDCLQDMGLSFDAWVFHHQLPQLAELALAFPRLPMVLNHQAGPVGVGPYAGQQEAVFAVWERGMSQLAACPNVSVKLGGRTLTMAGFGWHKREQPPGSAELAEAMAPYYLRVIELFGAGRCMFESNFPVDRASCSYTVLWNAFKRVSAHLSASDQAQLFHATAERVYRLT